MVHKPCRTSVHQCVIASSLALSCLWSASALATSCPVYQFSSVSSEAPFDNRINAAKSSNRQTQLTLKQGLLQPQLEKFLRDQFAIKTIDWRVSPHYKWPANFTLKAVSAEALLEQLLVPYTFVVTMFSNHAAIISYRYDAAEAL
ncbi:MAG: hypothetical protein B7X54_02295 [Idiomarina sp. 34-48-12]|nr:MAG: hypothetical protein B7X54_02295 [Idiomarina sp. 34-48-12]